MSHAVGKPGVAYSPNLFRGWFGILLDLAGEQLGRIGRFDFPVHDDLTHREFLAVVILVITGIGEEPAGLERGTAVEALCRCVFSLDSDFGFVVMGYWSLLVRFP